jgi:small subunit ribosomal protein S1
MVPQRKPVDEPLPQNDDGWWASVLADEKRYAPAGTQPHKPPVQAPKKDEPRKPDQDDWLRARNLYEKDSIVSMVVTGFNRGGLLVEGDGMTGFVPFSHLIEMTGMNNPVEREKALADYVGKTLRLKVIECVPEDGRVVFSERAAQCEAGRRKELFETLEPGQQVKGEVTNITDFGVFVDLGGVEGLIHISELSWGRVTHPTTIVSLGQMLDVQVLEVAPERCRVALSLKRLFDNPWEHAAAVYGIDQVVPAVVTSIVSYGAFARLEEGLEGLVHASEIPLEAGQSIKDAIQEGQQVKVRILHIDAAHQRLGLSLRVDE